METTVPIPTLHLFPVLDHLLIEVLQSLSADDWNKPALAREWTVKDVAAHLLDGNLKALSISRDSYMGDPPGVINGYQDLVGYLNNLNATWVSATKRLSPNVLIDLLKHTGKQYIAHLQTLSPFEPAIFSVAWAGEEQSANWFHIAREYTEKWHHQQQIRLAVNKQFPLMSRELYYPCIDTFMQALPYTYRNTDAPAGTMVSILVEGEAGGEWQLHKKDASWQLLKGTPHLPVITFVSLSPDVAWKLFTKAITPDEAYQSAKIGGEKQLAKPLFGMLAVMA